MATRGPKWSLFAIVWNIFCLLVSIQVFDNVRPYGIQHVWADAYSLQHVQYMPTFWTSNCILKICRQSFHEVSLLRQYLQSALSQTSVQVVPANSRIWHLGYDVLLGSRRNVDGVLIYFWPALFHSGTISGNCRLCSQKAGYLIRQTFLGKSGVCDPVFGWQIRQDYYRLRNNSLFIGFWNADLEFRMSYYYFHQFHQPLSITCNLIIKIYC
jgi:hypothetical protein